MKKKVIARTLLGFPLGVFIGYTITILISLINGTGAYLPAVPQLALQMGSQLGAVVLQYALAGVLGAACAGGSCVWEMPDWSLLKQTIVHFLILTTSMFPIAWFTWWMPHTVAGALLYIGIFVALYLIIFAIMYFFWKSKIKRMNNCIRESNAKNQPSN